MVSNWKPGGRLDDPRLSHDTGHCHAHSPRRSTGRVTAGTKRRQAEAVVPSSVFPEPTRAASRFIGMICLSVLVLAAACSSDSASPSCPGGTCAIPAGVPTDPKCYTPCGKSFTDADGTYHACDADGLMAGCFGGSICVQGSCVPATGAVRPAAMIAGALSAADIECAGGHCDDRVPRCAADTDCPSHQTCIAAQCYSTCEQDGDCGDGTSCYLRVCRAPCEPGAADCGTETYCEIHGGGSSGHCMPVAPPDADPGPTTGGFYLDSTSLRFSPTLTDAKLLLVNLAATAQSFTISRDTVTFYDEVGEPVARADASECDSASPTEDTCPLYWIGIGAGDTPTRGPQSLELEIPGGCQEPIPCVDSDECPGSMGCQAAGQGGYCVCNDPGCTDYTACAREVILSHLGDAQTQAAHWQGSLSITTPRTGSQSVALQYQDSIAGNWSGAMYFFSSFGDDLLDAWMASDHSDASLLGNARNALLSRWAAFRGGVLSYDELQAVLTSTLTASWRSPTVRQECLRLSGGQVENCYLTHQGPVQYSNDLDLFPIPTGPAELPLAVNLRPGDTPDVLRGRIESTTAMQYPGNPAIALTFADPASGCTDVTAAGECVTAIRRIGTTATADNVEVRIGGRYLTTAGDSSCDASGSGFEQVALPWTVSGFVPPGYQWANAADRLLAPSYAYECRDSQLPFIAADPADQGALAPRNTSMAAANPIPDGWPRARRLELVDGFMVDANVIYLVVKESFGLRLSSSNEKTFSGYALVVLKRNRMTLPDDAFTGTDFASDTRTYAAADLLSPVCGQAVLDAIPGVSDLDATTADVVVETIINGIAPANAPRVVYPLSDDADGDGIIETWEDVPPLGEITTVSNPAWAPHYFCEDTGLIDGGPEDDGNAASVPAANADVCALARNQVCDDGGPDASGGDCPLGTDFTDCGTRYREDPRVTCPAASRVVYFLLRTIAYNQAEIAALPCQQSGSCWQTVLSMQQQGAVLDPVWTCQNRSYSYCSNNRYDLREGKVFYAPSEDAAVFAPLLSDVDDAFRYKTRFVSRTGKTVGFTPELCDPVSDQVPYCYSPVTVELIQQRINCLLDVHQRFYSDLESTTVRPLLDKMLETIFSRDDETDRDGFERLNAELLVMLGDDAFTRAAAARFDLAASSQASFEGTLFEPGGINLTGGAGFEMSNLYQAVQYYDLALGRFYALNPAIWEALGYGGSSRNFVSQATVTTYLTRIANASTRKAQAWAEIATRYQNFNRPDLARLVIERAYAGTYTESVLLARMIWEFRQNAAPEDVPQIDTTLEEIQTRYRIALASMKEDYSSITDDVNYFGFPPDYVPFPPLANSASGDQSAFTTALATAWSKVNLAAERERTALSDSREFDTDAELFQTELADIQRSYYDTLGALCGTFIGRDGLAYPAIASLAYLDDRASEFGDPCGLMGNGDIHEARVGIEQASLAIDRVVQEEKNVELSVENERDRVAQYCAVNEEVVDFQYQKAGAILGIRTTIDTVSATVQSLRTAYNMAQDWLSIGECEPPTVGTSNSPGSCPYSAIAGGTLASLGTPLMVMEGATSAAIVAMNAGIAQIERETARYVGLASCDFARIDSEAKMFDMLLQLNVLQVDMLEAQYDLQLALSKAERLHNDAISAMANWQQANQLLINAEAARNDPNVRIYRNDAVLNAERAFNQALVAVYKATRVFEYYTSQSYGPKEELFLVRMVEVGDFNLVNYLNELETTFADFQEQFGNPDTRVTVLSVRDDILQIPRLDASMQAVPQAERIAELRHRLADGSLIDDHGYLSFSFSTSLERLSPLTRNHKILLLEAELVGPDVGDNVARLYVRQSGTSTVQGVDGERTYYQFPGRTAVLNPFFNGDRRDFSLATNVYSNYRLRDRPYINSAWSVMLNQVDEYENQDINLNGIDDIRLHVYYTDFTDF